MDETRTLRKQPLKSKKSAAKSVYTTGGRENPVKERRSSRARTKSVANDMLGSNVSYAEDFDMPGGKGSFSDKQTITNYDNVSKMTKGTALKKGSKSSARKPLPKVEDIKKKNVQKGVSKAPVLDMNDAADYFDNPEEKEAVKRAVQGIFKVNKSQEYNQRQFGVTMQEWETSR